MGGRSSFNPSKNAPVSRTAPPKLRRRSFPLRAPRSEKLLGLSYHVELLQPSNELLDLDKPVTEISLQGVNLLRIGIGEAKIWGRSVSLVRSL